MEAGKMAEAREFAIAEGEVQFKEAKATVKMLLVIFTGAENATAYPNDGAAFFYR